ncbi:MAG: S8 family serine peptidase, partial [Muribaculaceae bacterium]|nr:S8 family serine peptidase [Muribaculaceae bacterium]
MNKFYLLAFLLPALPIAAQARLGLNDRVQLGEMLAASKAAKGVSEIQEPRVSMLARIADDSALDALRVAGADVEQREGDIVVLSAPLSKAEAVASAEGVVTASLSKQLYTYDWSSPVGTDFSRQVLGLDKIHEGVSPLPQVYDGSGVVLGVIDAGIDVHHVNFKDADGNYRVKRAFKHAVVGNSSVTLTADTPEKMAKFTTDNAAMTHGTHVMGIAAGSFRDTEAGAPDFRGAAPGADIAVSCGVSDNARLIKGARMIVDYAKSEGKPCVINISMGNNVGPHDGTDEFPAALGNMIAEEGVVVCVASGNEGAEKAFLYADFTEGNTTMKSFICPTNYTAAAWGSISLYPQALGGMEVWSEDSTPFDLSFDLVDRMTGETVASYTIPSDGRVGAMSSATDLTIRVDDLVGDNQAFNSAYRGSYVMGSGSVYPANNRYHAELNVRLE